MTVLGLVTIGQTPRTDLVPHLSRYWPGVQVLEAGALDGLTSGQVRDTPIRPGDEQLTSRLADGSSVAFGRDLILERLQGCISGLERDGADAVLLMCTGTFPAFDHDRPLLSAHSLLLGAVAALADGPLGVLCPLPEQAEGSRAKFAHLGEVLVEVRDPYRDDAEQLREAAGALVRRGATTLVMDCMGYTDEQRATARAAGVPVILARSVVARLAAEVVLP